MSLGDNAFDRLAYDLVQTDFDAVERDGYRAEWNDEGTLVHVRRLDDDEVVEYNGDDLVRASSDRELNHAREPET